MAEAEIVADPVVGAAYYKEARVLLMMQAEVVQPVTEYYFDEEADLEDISPEDEKANHYYGRPKNRAIDDISDYNEWWYIRFLKDKLRRIYRLFNIEDGAVSI